MTDEERRTVCPRKWERIESEDGLEPTRDLIEKALARAATEVERPGEN